MLENNDTFGNISYQTSFIPGDRDHYLLMPTVTVKQHDKLPKHIHFLLDISGSMSEHQRLEKAKSAIKTMASTLNEEDTYSIILFDDKTEVLIEKAQANDKNILDKLNNIKHRGGTNMVQAFAAIKSPKGIDPRQQTILLVTDGEDRSSATSAYTNIMLNLKKTFDDNLPTIVPVGIGENFDKTLLNKLAERTHSTLIEIPDSNQEESKKRFQEAEKFFQVRSEKVSLQINNEKPSIEFGNCPYNTEISRVVKRPIQEKDDYFSFKISGEKNTHHAVKTPEKNDYIVIASWVNHEVNHLIRKITETVSGIKMSSSNSNGMENNSGMTILMSNIEEKQNVIEEKQELQVEKSIQLTEHLNALNKLIECLPNQSKYPFVQDTKNNAELLAAVIKGILSYSFQNQQEMTKTLTICNNNVTKLVNLPNDDRTLLVNENVKGEGLINQNTYQKISSEIDFANRKALKNIISIDAGITNRNAILLDAQSTKINNLTWNIGQQLNEKQNISDLLKLLSQKIHASLDGGSKESCAKIVNVQFENTLILAENLDDFLENHNKKPVAFCRHHSLLASDVIGRFIDNGKLPKGYTVHHRRGTAYNLKAHSFVTIESTNNKEFYLFDSMHPGVIYNLNDPQEKKQAIEYYKTQGLDGLIEKDPKATISPEVLQHISDTQNDKLVDLDLTCPLSLELMLDPVTADGKHFYDRQSITQWLLNNNTCPQTRKPISLEDFAKEENVNHAENKLKAIRTWLSENVILPENEGVNQKKKEIGNKEKRFVEILDQFSIQLHAINNPKEKQCAMLLVKKLRSAYHAYQKDNNKTWKQFECENKELLEPLKRVQIKKETSLDTHSIIQSNKPSTLRPGNQFAKDEEIDIQYIPMPRLTPIERLKEIKIELLNKTLTRKAKKLLLNEWKEIKDKVVENCKRHNMITKEQKAILKLHRDGENGSKWCALFQKRETTHWRKVMDIDNKVDLKLDIIN